MGAECMLQEWAGLGEREDSQGDGGWWACLGLFSVGAKLLLFLPKALLLAVSFLESALPARLCRSDHEGVDSQKCSLPAGPSSFLFFTKKTFLSPKMTLRSAGL